MKAIFCEKPNDLRMKDIPPPTRKPGEALIRLRRVGICGTDLHAFKGNQPYFTYPRILGHELSAEVVEVDANEAGLKAGDPVVIIPYLECGRCIACRQGKTNCCVSMRVLGVHQEGGMQEYMTLPVDHLIKTTSLSFDQMAMIECLGIGCHAVWRSQIKEGETALVVGAGPIGIGVMQFAKEAGAKVIVMDVMIVRLEF
jgi:threonine dehydrogenase-like Zn-dependent dehydrogenase